MRREIPFGVALLIIVVAVLLIGAIGWFLTMRRPTGGGQAPKEFMPQKPPYAPGQMGGPTKSRPF